MTTSKLFTGWTNLDGTRVHEAPAHWPFGSMGPISEYSFRYAPDSAVYEKQPKVRKIKAEPAEGVEAVGTPPGLYAFAALTQTLSMLGEKQ